MEAFAFEFSAYGILSARLLGAWFQPPPKKKQKGHLFKLQVLRALLGGSGGLVSRLRTLVTHIVTRVSPPITHCQVDPPKEYTWVQHLEV